MAARDDNTDIDGDADTAKRLQPGFSPDEELRKSVGVSSVVFSTNFQQPVDILSN